MKVFAAAFVAAVSVISSVLLFASPAQAGTVAVSIMGYGFSPPVVTAAQGSTVTWTQKDVGIQHTSTSDQGFWHSAALSTGQTYSQRAAFENAGAYHYHCAIHTDMTGQVRVPIRAAGAPANGWTLRWSSLTSTPSSRAFDVQIKRPGSETWAAYRTDTAARTAFFNPARTGRYAFRAHTRNLVNGKHSGWSPVRTLDIT